VNRPSREALSAAAMAFAPATDVPRERVLLHSAISSLLKIFENVSFDETEAVDAISANGTLPELRPDLARSLFVTL
jgi:hypothetical protein